MLDSPSPTDPEIIRLTRGLATHLQAQVRGARRQTRDTLTGRKPYWLAHAPRLAGSPDPRVLLEVNRTPLPSPIVPPSSIHAWLDQAEWTTPDGPEPQLRPPGSEHSVDDVEVPDAVRHTYQNWLERWREWRDEEHDIASQRLCYEQLERLEREALQRADVEELVLGVGLLTSSDASGWSLRRHLLIWFVTIERDLETDSLRLVLPTGPQAQFEDGDLRNLTDAYKPLHGRGPWQDELTALYPFSPGVSTLLNEWKKRCWNAPLSFDPQHREPPILDGGEVAQVTLAPAVYLRPRDNRGFEKFYAAIAASLDGPDAASPLGLAQLVSEVDAEQRLRWLQSTPQGQRRMISADPLFPRASNGEQRRVLEDLSGDTVVVVQGPPGTGKTHTIANLICALLADGQRVLITSQKGQALQVLRDQLPPAVRQMCVAMNGLQRGGGDELGRSINALSDLAALTKPEDLRRDIAKLRLQRTDLNTKLDRAIRDLQLVREQEHTKHPAIARGYAGTLRDLVSSINAGRDRYSWIEPLPVGVPPDPPLTSDEGRELWRLLASETEERRARVNQIIPEPDVVPPPGRITAIVTTIAAAERILGTDRSAPAWTLANLTDASLGEIERHIDTAADALATCGLPDILTEWDAADWRLRAAETLLARRNPAYWNALFDEIGQVEPHSHTLTALDGTEIDLGPAPKTPHQLSRLLGQAKRLRAHLARGRRLRRVLRPQAQLTATDLLETCMIDGTPPSTVNHLSVIITLLQAEIAVTRALDAWAEVGVPVIHGPLRRRVAQLNDTSRNAQAIRKLITARDGIEQVLRRQGIRYALRNPADWDLLVAVMRAKSVVAGARQAAESLTQTTEALHLWSLREQAAPELTQLHTALRTRDLDRYAALRAQLDQGRVDKKAQQRCEALTHALTQAHPDLAHRLTRSIEDPSWHDRLSEFEFAWSWGTAVAYHHLTRQPGLDQTYEQHIDDIEQRLQEVTGNLAGKQALMHCLTRMTEPQRAALQSYKNHVSAVGRGHGRHKERAQKAAQAAMVEARDAVPAWIMPLAEIADALPPEADAFDVVIVDEASQAGIEALFLLWLAPRIVVVGDEQQCAPGQSPNTDSSAVFDSLDRHLDSLPLHKRQDFRPDSNLYELLSTKFPKVIRLSEHFRSMPEIIGWSSAQFYDNRLVPLRQFGADRLDPLKVVQVKDAIEEGRDASLRNRAEAEAIVDQVQKMIEDPLYRGKSIGIIALQTGRQVQVIESLLDQRIDPVDRKDRAIRVGQPPDFQGDQRDVVLLSMVVTRAKKALTARAERRRYNVAATRAKDQMWLFVSTSSETLSATDLRHSLVTYMLHPPATLTTDPSLDDAPPDKRQPPFQSLLEQRVFLELRRQGYAVVPQYPIANHRIGLVVIGDNGRLAVECDTPEIGKDPDQLQRDVQRERELRRAGWQFVRIRESEYLLDPEAALEELWRQLEQRGVEPRSLPPAPRHQARWKPAPLTDVEDDS
ncbi:AAA family ATPase [Plantactinospora sp. S1510]|uniref:AAA family ATPase n=1 Tax=Plantactinospora alkalitolerans TaxID=2789879 RepID=A0ABS0H0X0_9ACTN|nr:AAA domain-containing protein [Plantactinospora alkalitolerans]MBF9132109.1 AAA family ATPase [Plantactinospora alkalitolerans]